MEIVFLHMLFDALEVASATDKLDTIRENTSVGLTVQQSRYAAQMIETYAVVTSDKTDRILAKLEAAKKNKSGT